MSLLVIIGAVIIQLTDLSVFINTFIHLTIKHNSDVPFQRTKKVQIGKVMRIFLTFCSTFTLIDR